MIKTILLPDFYFDLHIEHGKSRVEKEKVNKIVDDIRDRLNESYGYPLSKVLEENLKYIVTESFIAAKRYFVYDDFKYLPENQEFGIKNENEECNDEIELRNSITRSIRDFISTGENYANFAIAFIPSNLNSFGEHFIRCFVIGFSRNLKDNKEEQEKLVNHIIEEMNRRCDGEEMKYPVKINTTNFD